MAKENYVREAGLIVDYLKANGYSLYSKSNLYSYFWIHKDYDSKEYRKEYNESKFSLKSSRLNILGTGDFSAENIKRKYLIEKWNSNSFKDKEYFKEIEYLIKNYQMDDVIEFIKLLPASALEKVKLIENLPVSILDAYNTTFDKLKVFLDESNYNQVEKDKFYIKFFKARKNQLKGKTGEAAEKFLMSIYKNDENALKPYFDFFPNIKNKFNDIELNIEEPGYVIFSQRLNVRKAAKILEGRSESKVQTWIETFSNSMAKSYKVWSSLDSIDKPNAIVEVRFYKSEQNTEINSKMTIENYNKKLKEFLIYISGLSEEPKLNFDYVEKWLMQSDLKEKLVFKDADKENKIKTNKI